MYLANFSIFSPKKMKRYGYLWMNSVTDMAVVPAVAKGKAMGEAMGTATAAAAATAVATATAVAEDMATATGTATAAATATAVTAAMAVATAAAVAMVMATAVASAAASEAAAEVVMVTVVTMILTETVRRGACRMDECTSRGRTGRLTAAPPVLARFVLNKSINYNNTLAEFPGEIPCKNLTELRIYKR